MKKIASIDIGLKRIGIAIAVNSMVFPREAILRKNRNQASRDVRAFLESEKIEILIVGVPLGGSSEDEMRARISHFVSLLEFKGEIFFQDESFSSYDAKELIKGNFKDKRDGKLDSLSAKIILERWLEEKR